MNMFNCFQAMAFYSLLPFGCYWLQKEGHTGFFYVACVAWLIGYIMVSIAIHESDLLKGK
jgi:hypothetical protein